jgi:PAS domain S-box-containing protein
LFATFLEISSEAIWVMDVAEKKMNWYTSKSNEEKYRINGDKNFWIDNLHPEERERIAAGFQQALRDRNIMAYEHEYRFHGGDNVYYYIQDKMKFLRNALGHTTRVIGVWRDITDSKKKQLRLEHALETIESERSKFKFISEVSNAVMWEIDFSNGSVYWFAGNKTLADLGLNKSRYHLGDWEQTIYEEDRAMVKANFERIIASAGEHYFDTYRVKKSDGSLAHIIDQGTIIRDAGGKALRALGGWSDITRERHREEVLERALEHQRKLNDELAFREEELTSTEEELRQINEQLSENLKVLSSHEFILNQSQRLAKIGSWEYDLETQSIFWSDEMYSIYGVDKSFDKYDLDEMASLFEDSSASLVIETFKNIANQKRLPFDITARLNTPVGYKKWVRITGYPIKEKGVLQKAVGLIYDITYFKEAEERLRSSEEKFSRAFRDNPDLMVIAREDDKMIFDANEKVYEVLGYTRDEVVGRLSSDFKFFVHKKDLVDYFDDYMANGFAKIEAQWYKKDGKIIEVMITSNRLEFDGSRFYISVIKDISDRKVAEEKFQKAFSLSPDLMLIFCENDMRLIDANSKLEMVSGYTFEEVVGKSAVDFDLWVNIEDRDNYFEGLRNNKQVVYEALLRKKDGSQFFAIISASIIELSGESHIIVIVRDITEKKVSEEALRLSEANLNATINNTEMMIWSVNREMELIKFNEPFRAFVKQTFDRDLRIGVRIFDETRNGDEEDVKRRWTNRYTRAMAGEIVKIEEPRWGTYLQFSLSPIIENNSITGVSVFAEDISERMERNLQLTEANKKIGELKLMALRSVMNPHFIFNALNSIQYFIAKNDRKNAINYLSTFSKLIRGILTNSVNNKIKLAEELDQLKYYVDLELVRFDNKFDFVMKVEPGLDLDNIEIPSLLIQPYVENAILHGLYSKQGRGLLTITVKEDNGNILFEIEDNGVGREVAKRLRQQNFPKHQSMGTALTEERLKLINAKDDVSFEIIDLYADNVPSGTRIKIRVKE